MPGKKVVLRLRRINDSLISDEEKQQIKNLFTELIISFFNNKHWYELDEDDDELNFHIKVNREGENGNRLLAKFKLPDDELSEDFNCEEFEEWANEVLPGFPHTMLNNIVAFYPFNSRLICSSCNVEVPEVIQAGGRKTVAGKRHSSKKTTKRTTTKRRSSGGKRRRSSQRRRI